MKAIDLSRGAIPLYQQLAEILQQGISNGTYPAGSKLPTELELSNTYHVSRVTVRKALGILTDHDEIERKTGKGTFVKERKLRRNLSGSVSSFTKMCLQMGTKPSAKTIRAAFLTPDETIREAMQLGPKDTALIVERIRYSDTTPVMIERDYFTPDFDFLFEEDLNHNSLFEIIRNRKGIVFTAASRTIDIIFASAAEARHLGVKTGYPLLRIMNLTQDSTGTITTYSEQLCIGDKFRLQV